VALHMSTLLEDLVIPGVEAVRAESVFMFDACKEQTAEGVEDRI